MKKFYQVNRKLAILTLSGLLLTACKSPIPITIIVPPPQWVCPTGKTIVHKNGTYHLSKHCRRYDSLDCIEDNGTYDTWSCMDNPPDFLN
jgi:hypothetical protein